jgi:hypothetical protein
MKKALPSILAALAALLTVFAPQLQSLISAHPSVAAVLMSLYSIMAHLLPSPVVQQESK